MATGAVLSKAKGSSGADVFEWQGLLTSAGFPTPVTGVFDDATDASTRAWQKSRGLMVDGIVGPASWTAMTGKTPTPAPGIDKNAQFGRDALLIAWPLVLEEARGSKYPEVQALGAEPGPNLSELQIAGAMAQLESNYGLSSYTNKKTGEKAVLNNWGAIQAGKPPCGDNFEVTDTGPQGEYNFCYRRYATPADGALDFLRHLTIKRPHSWTAMKTGDIDEYSVRMHSWTPPLVSLGAGTGSSKLNLDPITKMPGYFEQPPLTPKGRAFGLEFRAVNIANTLGEPLMAKRGGPVPQAGEPGVGPGEIIPGLGPAPVGTKAIARKGLIALLLGGAAYLAYRFRKVWLP